MLNKFLFCIFILKISILKFGECGIKVIADDKFNYDCLDAHNFYRDYHENTAKLTLNKNATDYAVSRIRTLAKLDGGRPTNQPNKVVMGENFYWYYDNTGYHKCGSAVDLWYKGYHHYDFNHPRFTEKSGGFSQVVWRGTKQIGCARVEDDTRRYYETYILCSYYPPGNVDGQYPYHVLPIRSREPSHKPDREPPYRPDKDREPPNRPDREPPYRPEPPSRPDRDREPPSRPDRDREPPSRPDRDREPPNRPDRERPDSGSRPGRPPVPPSYPLDDSPSV
jgi:hypothetical protein